MMDGELKKRLQKYTGAMTACKQCGSISDGFLALPNILNDIDEAKKELTKIRESVALMPHSRRETEWIIQIDTFLIEWFGDSS